MSMKVTTFFKTLNQKIEKYDKLATNPFFKSQSIVLIWIENTESQEENLEAKN